MLCQDRLKTNLLRLFAHPENSEWFYVISVFTFEVKIVAEQKQAHIGDNFLVFICIHCPQLFDCPLPCHSSGVTAGRHKIRWIFLLSTISSHL